MAKCVIISTDKPASVFCGQADKDYLAARLLFGCGGGFFGLAAYHSQQSLEKYLKAYTVQEAFKFLKTHDLTSLTEAASNYNTYFSEDRVKEALEKFNVYDQVTRYGAEAFNDPFRRKNGKIEISGMCYFSFEHIKLLDKLVYEIRNMFNFEKMKCVDGLKAILEERKDFGLVATWKLPIPIKKVLCIKNDYYK